MDSSGSDDEGAQNGSGSVAAVVETLTELANLQTPASVWLPNKRLTMQATGKVRRRSAHGEGCMRLYAAPRHVATAVARAPCAWRRL